MGEVMNRVNNIIFSQTRGDKKPERIFIGKELFQQFKEECLPIYEAQYGRLISDCKACRDGYENIVFQGAAICLEDDETIIWK